MWPSALRVAGAPHRRRVRADLALAGLLAGLVAGCASSTTSGAARSLVVLTADQATEVVVPAGAFDQPVPTTAPSTSAVPTTVSSSSESSTTESSGSGPSDGDDGSAATTVAAETASEATTTTTSTTTTSTTTTSTATTSTTAPTTTEAPLTKETVPLAEEDVHPGVKLMGALDDFNRCLDGEGHQWIGFPDAALGPEDPVNQPGYLEALQFCNGRTQISKVYQEFQTSRAELTPDEIRQENEDFIELADCLRKRGWTVGELRPDEAGLLNPGDEFSGPDGQIVTDDIRDCVSEISLARGED